MNIQILPNNKFGCISWLIELDIQLHLIIHETNTKSYLVEFKEIKLFSKSILFSYISDKSLRITICNAFDEVYKCLLSNRKYTWTNIQKENVLKNVLIQFEHYFSKSEKYSEIYDFLKSLSPDIEIKENDNEIKYLLRISSVASSIYSIKEVNEQIIIFFSQFNQLGLFFLKWEYPLNKAHSVIIEDFEKSFKELLLKIQKKKLDNLMDDFYSDNSLNSFVLNTFEFDKFTWDLDEKNYRIKLIFDCKGEEIIVYRDAGFDFGSIVLLDSGKTINELISGLNLGSSFNLLNKKGIFFSNILDQVFIKDWDSNEFVKYQLEVKAKKMSNNLNKSV